MIAQDIGTGLNLQSSVHFNKTKRILKIENLLTKKNAFYKVFTFRMANFFILSNLT